MANFTRFTTFPIFYHQSISFLQKSQQILVRGGYIVKFFNFLELFHTKGAPNDPQWQIWPKKWLRLGQNGQFWSFCRFFPQERLGLTQNGQFHPIHNFSHLFPPKHLIFAEISKIFISGGRVHWQIFLSFSTFSNCFTPKGLQMTHNGKFGQKSVLDLVKYGQFWSFCRFFPQSDVEIDSEWPISPNF